MKMCNQCQLEKELEEFWIDRKNKKDGRENKCIICRKEKSRIYLLENKEILYEKRRNYNDSNREYVRERQRIYYYNNKERISKNRDRYRQKNRDKIRESNKKYREHNHDRVLQSSREYRKKFKNCPMFKLISVIRSSILKSLKRNGFSKNSKTKEILDCSFEEFKLHIESKFEPWMNWSNHGIYTGNYNETWQLDHIIPVDYASTEEEIYILNKFSNFQPLCSKKNLEKSNKILE